MKAFWLFLEAWWFWIDWGTFALAILSVPSVVMRRQGRPVAAVSWILCLVGLPIVGLLLWWLIGRSHLERRRRRKRRAHDTIASRLSSIHDKLAPLPSHSPTLHSLTHLPAELVDSVFPPTSGNDVELIDAHHAFDVMEETISKAKHHVHALFYIWKDDETGRRFLDLLAARAREGVEVRVLCDAVGSPMLAAKLMRPLRKAGVKFSRFLPPQLLSLTPRLNFRNHRKIVVVDGKVGFIGGFNMADEYRREWRDLGIQVRGPAVDQLQEIFADDWYYATKEDIAASSYFGQWTRFTTNG
ncbi:MAG: PLDc N-terminal domain-containing protein, partial [Myxococcales bacterium]|nr:PLDc N-terminal domain-containing protein [Myxococcales bacterium]